MDYFKRVWISNLLDELKHPKELFALFIYLSFYRDTHRQRKNISFVTFGKQVFSLFSFTLAFRKGSVCLLKGQNAIFTIIDIAINKNVIFKIRLEILLL